LAVSTAAWLVRERGQRELLVDLDTQGHAGKVLGVAVRTRPHKVFLLSDEAGALQRLRPAAPTASRTGCARRK
jgi:chromosome partitioning protein